MRQDQEQEELRRIDELRKATLLGQIQFESKMSSSQLKQFVAKQNKYTTHYRHKSFVRLKEKVKKEFEES